MAEPWENAMRQNQEFEEKPAKKLLRVQRATRVWWGHGPNSEFVLSDGNLTQILKLNILFVLQ